MLRSIGIALLLVVASVVTPIAHASAAQNPWPHVVINGFSTASGKGYWLLYEDGTVSATGDAHFYGDASRLSLQRPVVGGAMTPSGHGYWLVASDGGIFSYGDARFYGSMGAAHLNQPVFSMTSSRTGRGYWLVARDGGMFSFGDARFFGSMGGTPLSQPIDGITRSHSGNGYRLVARDGGVFNFGDAANYGSLPGRGIHTTNVIGMATTPTNGGYWLARSDGTVDSFGDARHFNSYQASPFNPVQAIFPVPKTQGYRLVTTSGSIVSFGTVPAVSLPPPPTISGPTGDNAYSIRDSQCTAAEKTCTMTFSETTHDRNPFSGFEFNDPKPGLLTGTTDGDLQTIASMPTCTGAGPFHNCKPRGYTSGRLVLDAPDNDNQTYYWDNCLITSPVQFGHSGIAVPGLAAYFTNCHVYITGDDGGYGTIGNAASGGVHFVHDLFDGSRAPTTTHPLSFVGGTSNYVYYSEFSQNTDQAILDAPVDFEWNYMHNSRCDKSTNAACVHTDGGPEVYGDSVPTSTDHPIIIANNYFSCLCDSSGGPANIAPYGGGVVRYLWIVNNKALPTYGSGYNSQGIIVDPQTGPGSISDVHITGNTFYASAQHPPSGLGDSASGGSCGGSLPNGCIAEISGNTAVNANGSSTRWP